MAIKEKILFVCVHNSARSQIAEEMMNKLGFEFFEAESAGLEPGTINPLVVKVLAEDGIDISNKQTKNIKDTWKKGTLYSYIITVCSRETEKKCPVFPGETKHINWAYPDPEKFEGTEEEKLQMCRDLKSVITEQLRQFINFYKENK